MKRKPLLLALLFLTHLGLYTQTNAGIQSRKSVVQYYQHDSQKGLKLLEAKLNRTVSVVWNEHNSTPTFVGGKLTPAGYSTSTDKAIDGMRFLSENTEMFGLKDPAKELEVISNFTDELSMTHVKYQQSLNGIKIFQNQLIVHFNKDGSIESVNGRYFPTPNMATVPTINADAAISIAEKKSDQYGSTNTSAELMIYSKDTKLLLVYAVHLPSYEKPKMVVFIDAMNGDVIKIDDGIRYDGPVLGSGLGLNGVSKPLHTYLSGGKYYMIDASLPMFVAPIDSFKGVIDSYDALNDTAGNGYQKAVGIISDPNSDNIFNDNERLKAAVDAQIFSRNVYEIYKGRYNRSSFDNTGGTLINVVHYKQSYNNAFWNGSFMTYGDGDGVMFSNLAGGFDVIAHEITHGVDEKTANLVYELQSGALNEAVSDIFGVIADSTNWTIGEDVYTPAIAGDALRNMQDPHNGHVQGDPDWQPANMSEFVVLANDDKHDHGGVHINSGIINKAFYNFASVIGRTKGGLIWYRALTVYLTNTAQFIDARNSCLNAAKDLFGIGSAEYTSVADGFTAVGIGPNSVTTYNLTYDDGSPATSVYEDLANWELAVRFTPPIANVKITNVKVYINGTNAGTGSFTLKMYQADGANSFPGTQIITPYAYSPTVIGWQSFDLTGAAAPGDFYVSAKYDGINKPFIGADAPPGNQKAYESNGSTWGKLVSPNDYTLFMRATVTSTTGVTEIDTKVPARFELSQNYPNPFNPSTVIRYSLPTAQNLMLAVYDVNGKKIADLVDNFQNSGTYQVTWNGTNNSGEPVASGMYFYRLETQSIKETKKLLLMK